MYILSETTEEDTLKYFDLDSGISYEFYPGIDTLYVWLPPTKDDPLVYEGKFAFLIKRHLDKNTKEIA